MIKIKDLIEAIPRFKYVHWVNVVPALADLAAELRTNGHYRAAIHVTTAKQLAVDCPRTRENQDKIIKHLKKANALLKAAEKRDPILQRLSKGKK
jgi:hypothetical protein